MAPSTEDLLCEQARRISPGERQQLLDMHIEPHPHKGDPAEARLRETGAPVWAIIGHLSAVSGDLNQVARDYEVDLDAVIAAVLFYQDHKNLIDWRLRQNRDEPVRLD